MEENMAVDGPFYFMLHDWTWWTWSVTAVLLSIGLTGYTGAFQVALGITGMQTVVMLIREKSLMAFPVQLRIAYGCLLVICLIPAMQWLFWLPAVGTFALIAFGYCLLARALSLFPWNRTETLSGELLLRTFLSRPRLARVTESERGKGCAGGMCTIAAQVPKRSQNGSRPTLTS